MPWKRHPNGGRIWMCEIWRVGWKEAMEKIQTGTHRLDGRVLTCVKEFGSTHRTQVGCAEYYLTTRSLEILKKKLLM